MRADDAFFWERLDGMPDCEALDELKLRKDSVVLENNMLNNELSRASDRERHEIGVVMFQNNELLRKLNREIHLTSERITKTSWRKAILAVFGEEGLEKCRAWVMQEESSLKAGGRSAAV